MAITHCKIFGGGHAPVTPVPLADREQRYREVRKFDKTYTREDLEGDSVFYIEGRKGMYCITEQWGATTRLDPAGEDEWQAELDFYNRTDNCVAFTSQNR